MNFPSGSVGETLRWMCGVWHDHIQLFELNGDPLPEDRWSGTPGHAPFDNLVYCDFDGEVYKQTNVCFRGRPLHVRSFRGVLKDGVLCFATLGPDDPQHVGISAGPGRIIFCPKVVTGAWQRYAEPDFIQVSPHGTRLRTTVLYRDGEARRTLHASGQRVSSDTSQRISYDPRGVEGDVHGQPGSTEVFRYRSEKG